MSHFHTDIPSRLADFLYPVTFEQAGKICAFARSAKDKTCYAAVYGPDMYHNPTKLAIYVTAEAETPDGRVWYHAVIDEYHPRKYGKAQLELGFPTRKHRASK